MMVSRQMLAIGQEQTEKDTVCEEEGNNGGAAMTSDYKL